MSTYDVVLCRSFGDEPLVRVAWSITKEGILICRQENFDLWKKMGIAPLAALAPFDMVYEYNEDLFHQLDDAFRSSGNRSVQLEQLWQEAKPYKPMEK